MNELKENPLSISWHDSTWIPLLNPNNVLDYFSERSNPLYDRTCNNEIIKMQKSTNQHLVNMTGLEYILLHVQEPILYVIRKQHRHSPTQVTPIADYYVLAGYVYQAPDLNTVISSRMSTAIHHLCSAFEKVHSFMRFHPTKGYTWDFGKDADASKDASKLEKNEKSKEENFQTSTVFQRSKVDYLLVDLEKKFPPKLLPQIPAQAVNTAVANTTAAAINEKPAVNGNQNEDKPAVEQVKTEIKSEIKIDKQDQLNRSAGSQPPEKRQRLG